LISGGGKKLFGWPAWSKNNCEYYTNSLYTSTCSVLQSVGLPHIYFADEDKLSMQTKYVPNQNWQNVAVLEPLNLTYDRQVCTPSNMVDSFVQNDREMLMSKFQRISGLQKGQTINQWQK